MLENDLLKTKTLAESSDHIWIDFDLLNKYFIKIYALVRLT